MDIKIGDKVRFNQKGWAIPDEKENWFGIGSKYVSQAKNLGTGTVVKITFGNSTPTLMIDFHDPNMPLFFWPAECFEKVPEGEKLELTQEEKELLRELVQEKLNGYQKLLDKLQ